MRAHQRDNVVDLPELCVPEPVGELAQHLDALMVLLEADTYRLALQLFEFSARNGVHLCIGLPEEIDRVVHELCDRLRCWRAHGPPIGIWLAFAGLICRC